MNIHSAGFKVFFYLFIGFTGCYQPLLAQYNPIAVTGFNHDVVAESGSNSLSTTSIPLDGVTVSNKVMYSVTFRDLNGFGGGALPDNGYINNASGTYQLAPYTSNNALLLQRTQTGDLTLNTPAKFSSLRIAALSTEGVSLINITLFFTDGSSTVAVTNYSLTDWFNGTTNLVETGFGRCNRVAAVVPSDADAYPNNPRLYYINISLGCVDRTKNLQKISFANVTTGGSNAPYPNAVFMAVSGGASTQNIFPIINNATCSSNGSVTLNVNGSTGPYTINWNTTPVQNGNTATNLVPGNYQATITDALGCSSTYPVTIGLQNTIGITSHADTTICYGASFIPNTISNATGYSWSPATGVSNVNIANPVLSPLVTTTYTLTATLGTCTKVRSFIVTVNPAVTLNLHADTSICLGSSFTANSSGTATTYLWSPTAGVSNINIANPVLSPIVPTVYIVTASTGNCSVSKSFNVNVVQSVQVSAGNDVTITQGASVQLNGSGSQGIYLWTPAIGLSAINILNPVASPLVTTTYTLSITSAQGCSAKDDVDVTVIPYCVKPLNAISPNGDGINDQWLITNGNCLSKASVHVYNRYGSPVYENPDYKNDWEGTYKGKPVPDATYYYVIEYFLQDGRHVVVRGDLTILR